MGIIDAMFSRDDSGKYVFLDEEDEELFEELVAGKPDGGWPGPKPEHNQSETGHAPTTPPTTNWRRAVS